jgi:catechol 2,3-dioxygenase-like lactoylglutathione lyase family enzyme
VGLFDSILGRKAPARPDLDQLFALPSAGITLDVELDQRPTGVGSVAFRAPEGRAFADVQAEVQALLDADGGPKVEVDVDSYGYTWIVVRTDPPDLAGLVTDLHAVNSTLQDSGFGPTLLCSMVVFADPDGRRLGLVYLFKQGTFYPFAPAESAGTTIDGSPVRRRDNVLEIQVRDLLRNDLKVEPEASRWFAVWGAPGLDG